MTRRKVTAVEELTALAQEYARQKDVVTEECQRIETAWALLVKWKESRLVDAIYREAKARAIKVVYG